MSRQYSIKSFLRSAPNSLVIQYLERLGIDAKEVKNNKNLSESKIEPLFETIEKNENLRVRMDADFRNIEKLATEGGIKVIVEEAIIQNTGITEVLSDMKGHHEAVLWTFLNHPKVFAVASRFYGADNLPNRSWRKIKYLPDAPSATDKNSRDRLTQAIAAYYKSAEGRGKACKVEHYKRDDRLYWFCYVQDYAGTSIEFDDKGEFRRRTLKPAFEVIFVHHPIEKSLDTYVVGYKKTVQNLQKIWALSILNEQIEPTLEKEEVYNLTGLRNRNYPMLLEPGGEVEDVRIRKLKLEFTVPGSKRLTLEADVRSNEHAVYDLFDDLLEDDMKDLVQVKQVGFQFKFRSDGRRGQNTLSFVVSNPNSISLKYDPKHLIARDYLKRWGIDVSGSKK
ncbi:hypothetical protein J7L05_00810 [bacterium]|nr:hypothetical protein [bacterium]